MIPFDSFTKASSWVFKHAWGPVSVKLNAPWGKDANRKTFLCANGVYICMGEFFSESTGKPL